MITLDRLTAWAVPRDALTVPKPTAEAKLLDWFDCLGFTDPQPKAMALRWVGDSCVEIPVDEAIEDEDLVLSAESMASYCPTLEDVAAGCVSTVHDHDESFPGPVQLAPLATHQQVLQLPVRLGDHAFGWLVLHERRRPLRRLGLHPPPPP
jgi:hypothetical protein